MVIEASVSAVGYFMPIFAFLLVFIVVYALLFKTKVLGDNQAIMVFISFILSGFFIVQTSLVEFVKFTSAWFVVGVVMIFFLITLLGFLPGKTPFEFLSKGNWFSWVVFGVLIVLFIISSSYIFNWVVNWGLVQEWFSSEWFGMILLLVIAAIVAWKIVPVVKK
ncbi:MAG: hypothetical protein ABIH79_00295 [archaeon]